MSPFYKNIAVIFILLFTHYSGFGKRVETLRRAEIKVGYTCFERVLQDGIVQKEKPFVLLANSSGSKFFSPSTEYKDSLDSTPEGRALSARVRHEAFRRYFETKDESIMEGAVYKTHLYVFKDALKKEYEVYDHIMMGGRVCYTEPIEDMQWEISDSIRNILGYECHMATAGYHGRIWTAWFTPEIPLQEGPWKLCGLPGLILEASDATGQHRFVADGIEASSNLIYPIYNKVRYDYVDRLELLRQQRHAIDHASSIMRAETGIDAGTDRVRSEEEMLIDLIETDYHQ